MYLIILFSNVYHSMTNHLAFFWAPASPFEVDLSNFGFLLLFCDPSSSPPLQQEFEREYNNHCDDNRYLRCWSTECHILNVQYSMPIYVSSCFFLWWDLSWCLWWWLFPWCLWCLPWWSFLWWWWWCRWWWWLLLFWSVFDFDLPLLSFCDVGIPVLPLLDKGVLFWLSPPLPAPTPLKRRDALANTRRYDCMHR